MRVRDIRPPSLPTLVIPTLSRFSSPRSVSVYLAGYVLVPSMAARSLRRWLSRREAAAALLLCTFLVLLGVVLYKPAGASRGDGYTKLPELFVEAAAHLNRSTAAVERALAGREPVVDEEGARRTVGELVRFREVLEREDETEMIASLKRASEAYARLANSSVAAYEVARVLYGSRGAVRAFLDAILRCDAAEMSEKGALVEGNLTRAAELLGEVLAGLTAVKPSDLPSEEHRGLVEEAAERLARAYRALRELLKAVDLAKKHPQNLQELCRAKRGGGPALLSPDAAGAILSLNPGDAGPYSYHISRLRALLSSPGQSGDGYAGGTGSGAGYQPPPSDD